MYLILQKELTHTILLHPSCFGPCILQFLESKLCADVKGTCSGQYGYIIAAVSILDTDRGIDIGRSEQAEFVTRPLQVFVSHQLILIFANMKFNLISKLLSFASDDHIIEKNTRVRLKIIGTRFAIGTIKEDHLGVID
ncbi:hypothetical protein F5J12DRAFT_906519 [Pisolithus orientalis]|uniref:uncharacterized protein n=1 Tax=Pisolithus orientalis TaxID=936130 RepID=UPI0022246696|nr:uncharacterized protein F5J12DRAFT_906519 [Pisolithus orientalis]KAI6000947.1 hypothetical protein F5J12DRAFT_906519 [Pisolithus orientalis]